MAALLFILLAALLAACLLAGGASSSSCLLALLFAYLLYCIDTHRGILRKQRHHQSSYRPSNAPCTIPLLLDQIGKKTRRGRNRINDEQY